jgi:uncharacterized protein (TIGR00255 family)
MTGFGSASSEEAEHALRVEIRSVNHRHLLVKTRLPGELAALENEIERLVRKRLVRGSVSIYLSMNRIGNTQRAAVDGALVGRYKQELERIAAEHGLAGPSSIEPLLSLPGVLRISEEQEDPRRLGKRVTRLVDEALSRLLEMRRTEGAALVRDLRKHALALDKLVARIAKRMPTVTRAHQRALGKRVAELLESRAAVSESDLAREIALLADRLDVSEEVSRLQSHLAQLSAFIDKGGALGRKLDFLVQEIFREINTIGSKCNDAQVARWVVDSKAHSERLREQVQNVE